MRIQILLFKLLKPFQNERQNKKKKLLKPQLYILSRAMAKPNHKIARAFELRLLRCSLSPPTPETPSPPPSASPHHESLPLLIESVVSSIEKGDYSAALSSDAVRLVFPFADSWAFDDSIDGADRFYCDAESSASSFLQQSGSDAWLSVLETEEDGAERSLRAVLVLCIGVAAFLSFTQCNLTGLVIFVV